MIVVQLFIDTYCVYVCIYVTFAFMLHAHYQFEKINRAYTFNINTAHFRYALYDKPEIY